MKNDALTEIEAALSVIDAFPGRAEDFSLAIAESLLDAAGVNMSIITDKVLGRGWLPAGFEQRDGYRCYRYESQSGTER